MSIRTFKAAVLEDFVQIFKDPLIMKQIIKKAHEYEQNAPFLSINQKQSLITIMLVVQRFFKSRQEFEEVWTFALFTDL